MRYMYKEIIGFLNLEGWAGVEYIYTFVLVGVTIGISALYFFLLYHPEPKPKPITVSGHIFKIVVYLSVLVFLWTT